MCRAAASAGLHGVVFYHALLNSSQHARPGRGPRVPRIGVTDLHCVQSASPLHHAAHDRQEFIGSLALLGIEGVVELGKRWLHFF